MIYTFGKKSKKALYTCEEPLILSCENAIAKGLIDMTVMYGHRTPEYQFGLYQKGRKEVEGVWVIDDRNRVVTRCDGFKVLSNHNYYPSKAVDIFPWISGKISFDPKHCIFMAGVILSEAKSLGYDLRWGGNWDMDGEPVTDQDFQDLGHFEEVG